MLEAGSPDEARSALSSQQVHAVLLDLHLGPADGRALATELRGSRPDLGIVLMTGSADTLDKSVAADGVLPKPFDLGALRAAVAHATTARRHPV